MDQKIRFCTSADGVKLAYAVNGEGPPLVMSATWLTYLEHQWRSLAWRPWLDAFSSEHAVVRYDSRGCGLSDRKVDDVSSETTVGDFECIVEAAGFERFSLLGTCQGGTLAHLRSWSERQRAATRIFAAADRKRRAESKSRER